jgi:sarcosine oxidase subunit gamma
VAELAERGPLEGLGLPLEAGRAKLVELPWVRRVLLAPLRGEPAPGPVGRVAAVGGGRIVWAGLGQWLVEGEAAASTAGVAVTDQSDAWAGVALTGTAARDVLARLVPLDLDAAVFLPGTVARSMLRHVALLLIANDDGFELLVPRSMARTAIADIGAAMRAVAARAALTPGGVGL